MKTVILLISLALIFEFNTEAYTPIDLLGSLNLQIKNMTALINIIKEMYSDDPYNHPPPKLYLATLYRAQLALDDARNIFKKSEIINKDTLYRTRMQRERDNRIRSFNLYPRWYPKSNRSFEVVEDLDEDVINAPLWAEEKYKTDDQILVLDVLFISVKKFIYREGSNLGYGGKWIRANRRSIGDGWLPKNSYPRNSADRNNDDYEWNARFYRALSKVLKKELKDEPLISQRVGEGYEPAPVFKRRGV